MNFFEIKTCWSNAELVVFKLSIFSISIVIGSFFHSYIEDFYVPLFIIFLFTTILTIYLWLTKMKDSKNNKT